MGSRGVSYLRCYEASEDFLAIRLFRQYVSLPIVYLLLAEFLLLSLSLYVGATFVFGDPAAMTGNAPMWVRAPLYSATTVLSLLAVGLYSVRLRTGPFGVAVRIEGLTGKQGRRRLSLEEEDQERTRLQARAEMCRAHDIELIVIGLGDEPKAAFRASLQTIADADGQTHTMSVTDLRQLLVGYGSIYQALWTAAASVDVPPTE